MYKAKNWDEDKWDTHSSGYHSSKYDSSLISKDDSKYHEHKYGSDDKGIGSDYLRKTEEKQSEEKKDLFFEDDANNKEQAIKDEDIQFKAAKQVFEEHKNDSGKDEPNKDLKSIEDAIKKAIEDEKKVIIMD